MQLHFGILHQEEPDLYTKTAWIQKVPPIHFKELLHLHIESLFWAPSLTPNPWRQQIEEERLHA